LLNAVLLQRKCPFSATSSAKIFENNVERNELTLKNTGALMRMKE
jgi:hypothetical protein